MILFIFLKTLDIVAIRSLDKIPKTKIPKITIKS